MAMLSINGRAVLPPSEMKVAIFEPGNGAGRNAAGNMVLDRMGAKRRLRLKWAHMEGAQLSALLEAVGAGFFEAAYPDPEGGEMRTITCMCSERTAGMLRMERGLPVWTNIEMTWTER